VPDNVTLLDITTQVSISIVVRTSRNSANVTVSGHYLSRVSNQGIDRLEHIAVTSACASITTVKSNVKTNGITLLNIGDNLSLDGNCDGAADDTRTSGGVHVDDLRNVNIIGGTLVSCSHIDGVSRHARLENSDRDIGSLV
jgi:hypothetical protein